MSFSHRSVCFWPLAKLIETHLMTSSLNPQQYLVWTCDVESCATITHPSTFISSVATPCLHACPHSFQQDIPQLESKEWRRTTPEKHLERGLIEGAEERCCFSSKPQNPSQNVNAAYFPVTPG